jgi:hypothetical protein
VTISALLRDGREQQYQLRGSAMPASAMARSAQCSSVIASVAPFAFTTSTARCAASTALFVVAPFTQASSNQLRAVQPYKQCGCVFPWRLGWAIAIKAVIHAEAYLSPADQPASPARSQGRNCRPAKGSHRVIKPVSMYRTQVAAIADV